MCQYTTFHFRAKLSFQLPEEVAATLQSQCSRHLSETPVEGAPDGFNWAGSAAHPHQFFSLPNAGSIPGGSRSQEDYPAPDFRRYADGGAQLVFTCELKDYHDEVGQFLHWIAPFVRGRFGKRRRGRRGVWVGWWRPESADRRYNIFIYPAGSGGGREVIIR
jgi:hypothetical protein